MSMTCSDIKEELIKVARRRLASEFEMKDLNMMAWRCGRISWGQGKYVVEIMKRFSLMDYKSMTTPLESNMNLLSVASSKTVDAMMYRQMFCSLMFLMDPRHARLVAKHAVRCLKGTVEHDTN